MDPVVIKAWISIAYSVLGLVALLVVIVAIILITYNMIKKW